MNSKQLSDLAGQATMLEQRAKAAADAGGPLANQLLLIAYEFRRAATLARQAAELLVERGE
jgi:hypothetical protein